MTVLSDAGIRKACDVRMLQPGQNASFAGETQFIGTAYERRHGRNLPAIKVMENPRLCSGIKTLTEKPGRNSPCPCGSDRKFKQCCLGREAEMAARCHEAALAQLAQGHPEAAVPALITGLSTVSFIGPAAGPDNLLFPNSNNSPLLDTKGLGITDSAGTLYAILSPEPLGQPVTGNPYEQLVGNAAGQRTEIAGAGRSVSRAGHRHDSDCR
jgi:hypothetical protein